MDGHDAVNGRWLDYELDVGKLIDFPVMTDVREPLTVAFLRAKRTADSLRPGAPEDITTAAQLAEYREAVHSFELVFDVAEREARRIKDSNFTGPERVRLATARKLLQIASDAAATPAERQTADKRARHELDGLIVLPDATLAALEQTVAGMIGAGGKPMSIRADGSGHVCADPGEAHFQVVLHCPLSPVRFSTSSYFAERCTPSR